MDQINTKGQKINNVDQVHSKNTLNKENKKKLRN